MLSSLANRISARPRRVLVVAALFTVFAEDYKVDPIEGGGSSFTWSFAISPNKLAAPLFPVAFPLNKKLMMDGLFKDTERHFGKR